MIKGVAGTAGFVRNPIVDSQFPWRLACHARPARDQHHSQGGRRQRFDHVSAAMAPGAHAPEDGHLLCSLAWRTAPEGETRFGPLPSRGRRSLERQTARRGCATNFSHPSPHRMRLISVIHISVIHCWQISISPRCCKDQVLHRRPKAECRSGGPRPGRLLVHRPAR